MKGRKLGLKSMIWSRGKTNIQPGQNEETRIEKNEERLRNLQDNFKHSKSKSQGCQKEKRRSKKLKTYLKK